VQTVYTVTGTDANGCTNTASVLIKVSTCISIEEQTSSAGIRVFPNPGTGKLSIENLSGNNAQVYIVNAMGQKVWEGSAPTGTSSFETGLSKGVYLFYFKDPAGKTGNFRLLVE
jgi:hypothetical protein